MQKLKSYSTRSSDERHVHFAPEVPSHDGYSPPFFVAYSSSSSSSSSPSSQGPITPPSLGKGSPHQYLPLPNLSVTLHPALGTGSGFTYDLTTLPIPDAHPISHISESLWHRPVTNPPTSHMEMECSFLPWRITIVPAKNSTRTFITFGDFATGLYQSLRKQVTPGEYGAIKSQQHRSPIDNAYKRRYKRCTDYDKHESERQGGVRRVDFLGDFVNFAGLSCNPNAKAQWTLHVAPLPPSHLS